VVGFFLAFFKTIFIYLFIYLIYRNNGFEDMIKGKEGNEGGLEIFLSNKDIQKVTPF